jgi:hypothetical protein
MELSAKDMIQFFAENKKWWEDAADLCERRAESLRSPEKEAELLLAAVYRERADRHAQTIENLRKNVDSARG